MVCGPNWIIIQDVWDLGELFPMVRIEANLHVPSLFEFETLETNVELF